jgi:glycosyltransferase 2 family protein
VIRHLAASRWVKLGLLAITLGFCAYGLYAERADMAAALHHLAWYSVAGAAVAVIAGLGCMMLSWRALLADLGSPLRLRAATRILFVAQLGKYVPGSVWAMAAQVELARGHEVPRRRSASATVVAMLVTLATGLLVAAVALPLSSGAAVRHYWWALALAPPALIALYPPVMGWALDRALRLARRPPLERRVSGAGVLRAAAWSLAGWAFFSVHSWLLVAGVTGKGLSVLPIAAGAYALAWSVGFVLIPFPGGVGPRELAFIAALAPVMPRGSAIVVAVVSRLVLTIGDLVWAAVAFGLGRGGQRGAQGVARDDATGPAALGTTGGARGAATATGATGGARDGATATGTTAGAGDSARR